MANALKALLMGLGSQGGDLTGPFQRQYAMSQGRAENTRRHQMLQQQQEQEGAQFQQMFPIRQSDAMSRALTAETGAGRLGLDAHRSSPEFLDAGLRRAMTKTAASKAGTIEGVGAVGSHFGSGGDYGGLGQISADDLARGVAQAGKKSGAEAGARSQIKQREAHAAEKFRNPDYQLPKGFENVTPMPPPPTQGAVGAQNMQRRLDSIAKTMLSNIAKAKANEDDPALPLAQAQQQLFLLGLSQEETMDLARQLQQIATGTIAPDDDEAGLDDLSR